MALNTNIEEKLEGIEIFLAWKYRIGLILRENDLDKHIKGEVGELKKMKLRRSTRRT